MRPHILLLTTGGTIASLPTAEGLAPGLDGEALAGLLPQGVTLVLLPLYVTTQT